MFEGIMSSLYPRIDGTSCPNLAHPHIFEKCFQGFQKAIFHLQGKLA